MKNVSIPQSYHLLNMKYAPQWVVKIDRILLHHRPEENFPSTHVPLQQLHIILHLVYFYFRDGQHNAIKPGSQRTLMCFLNIPEVTVCSAWVYFWCSATSVYTQSLSLAGSQAQRIGSIFKIKHRKWAPTRTSTLHQSMGAVGKQFSGFQMEFQPPNGRGSFLDVDGTFYMTPLIIFWIRITAERTRRREKNACIWGVRESRKPHFLKVAAMNRALKTRWKQMLLSRISVGFGQSTPQTCHQEIVPTFETGHNMSP